MLHSNYSTLVFFVDTSVRAIKGIYEEDTSTKKQPRELFKTRDKSVKVGDYVIVPTDGRHNMALVQVTDVDVRLDLTSTEKARWIIDTVSTDKYEKIKSWEDKAIEAFQNNEAKKKCEQIREEMKGYFEGIEPLRLEDGEPKPEQPVKE